MDDDRVIGVDFDPVQLTPREFEQEVRRFFATSNSGLTNINVAHNEIIPRPDGDYQIDVTARFQALGADFLVLIECKHHKSPIKREVVQALHGKLGSIGAHKGIICATGGFQNGALRYAKQHGIALVHIVDGRATYIAKSYGHQIELPPWVPPYAAQLVWLGSETDEPLAIYCSLRPDVNDLYQIFGP